VQKRAFNSILPGKNQDLTPGTSDSSQNSYFATCLALDWRESVDWTWYNPEQRINIVMEQMMTVLEDSLNI
jgi:hypothetical protein